jgi:hypothetical protein
MRVPYQIPDYGPDRHQGARRTMGWRQRCAPAQPQRLLEHESDEFRTVLVQPEPAATNIQLTVTRLIDGGQVAQVTPLPPQGLALALGAGRVLVDVVVTPPGAATTVNAVLSHGAPLVTAFPQDVTLAAHASVTLPPLAFTRAIAVTVVHGTVRVTTGAGTLVLTAGTTARLAVTQAVTLAEGLVPPPPAPPGPPPTAGVSVLWEVVS